MIDDSSAAPHAGTQFEGKAGQKDKDEGDLTDSKQMSDASDNAEKIWWDCKLCGFRREGDQTHSDASGNDVAVEVKSKTALSMADARQLGRNCQSVAQGAAAGLAYKVPSGPQYSVMAGHIRRIAKDVYNIAVKIIRV